LSGSQYAEIPAAFFQINIFQKISMRLLLVNTIIIHLYLLTAFSYNDEIFRSLIKPYIILRSKISV